MVKVVRDKTVQNRGRRFDTHHGWKIRLTLRPAYIMTLVLSTRWPYPQAGLILTLASSPSTLVWRHPQAGLKLTLASSSRWSNPHAGLIFTLASSSRGSKTHAARKLNQWDSNLEFLRVTLVCCDYTIHPTEYGETLRHKYHPVPCLSMRWDITGTQP